MTRPKTAVGNLGREFGILPGTWWRMRRRHPGWTLEQWEHTLRYGDTSGPMTWGRVAEVLGVTRVWLWVRRRRGEVPETPDAAWEWAMIESLERRRRQSLPDRRWSRPCPRPYRRRETEPGGQAFPVGVWVELGPDGE